MNDLPSWWSSKFGDKPYHIGDCIEGMKQLPDGCVDAVITDPPFGINFDYKTSDDVAKNPNNYGKWLKSILNEIYRIVKDGGFIAIWQAQLYFKYFWDWFGEDIHIYASCKNFVQLRKTAINYGYDPVVMKYKEGKKLCPTNPSRSLDFFVCNTALFITEENSPAAQHPCPRPIDQVEEIASNFTIEHAIILDPFLGSGTTLLACRNTGRIGLGFELNPEYESIIRKRAMLDIPNIDKEDGWFG